MTPPLKVGGGTYARELRHGVIDVVGSYEIGDVAVALKVRHALAHLVVEDLVVLVDDGPGLL